MTDRQKHDPNRPDSTPDTRQRTDAEVDSDEKVVPQGSQMEEEQEQVRDRDEGDGIDDQAQIYQEAQKESEEVRRSGRKQKGEPIP